MQGNGSTLRVTAERHFVAGDKRLCLVEVGQAGGGFADKLTHQELPIRVELRKLFDNISQFVGRFIGKAVDTADDQVRICAGWPQDDRQAAGDGLDRGSLHGDRIRSADKRLAHGKTQTQIVPRQAAGKKDLVANPQDARPLMKLRQRPDRCPPI